MMATFAPGQRVTWMYVPRGGYYSPDRYYPVDGEVVRATAKRVVIRVRRQTGELVERSVTPDKLRAKED